LKPKETYVLRGFTKHADTSFPDDFAAFMALAGVQSSTKTYVDENQAAHQIDMLLVGHYWVKCGSPSAWACATGTTVHYFYGNLLETVCKPVLEHYRWRIYVESPFSTVTATPYDMHGAAAWQEARTAGVHISESVINYLFLHTGCLERVQNHENIDMLGNFKYACAAVASQAFSRSGPAHCDSGQPNAADDSATLSNSDKKRKRAPEQPRSRKRRTWLMTWVLIARPKVCHIVSRFANDTLTGKCRYYDADSAFCELFSFPPHA
jgi:hypothetical protein